MSVCLLAFMMQSHSNPLDEQAHRWARNDSASASYRGLLTVESKMCFAFKIR